MKTETTLDRLIKESLRASLDEWWNDRDRDGPKDDVVLMIRAVLRQEKTDPALDKFAAIQNAFTSMLDGFSKRLVVVESSSKEILNTNGVLVQNGKSTADIFVEFANRIKALEGRVDEVENDIKSRATHWNI